MDGDGYCDLAATSWESFEATGREGRARVLENEDEGQEERQAPARCSGGADLHGIMLRRVLILV